MTCPLCTHAARPAIDGTLVAHHREAAQGAAPKESYGQVAKRFNVPKPVLLRHRDECLGLSRAELSRSAPDRDRLERKVGIENDSAVLSEEMAGQNPPTPHKEPARARNTSAQLVPSARSAPYPRTNEHLKPPEIKDRIAELATLVIDSKWEGHKTVEVYMRKWGLSRVQVLDHFRAACAIVKISRGDLAAQIEQSLARWLELYRKALQRDDEGAKDALRVAAEALKGYDRAAGIVDSGTKVQVNIAQSPQGQEFLRFVFSSLTKHGHLRALADLRADMLAAKTGGEEAIVVDGGP